MHFFILILTFCSVQLGLTYLLTRLFSINVTGSIEIAEDETAKQIKRGKDIETAVFNVLYLFPKKLNNEDKIKLNRLMEVLTSNQTSGTQKFVN